MDMSLEKLADAYRLMRTIREFEERMRSSNSRIVLISR